MRRVERFVGKEDHGVLGVPKPEGHYPGSEEEREAAPDGTGNDLTPHRTQRVQAVNDLNQVRLGRGASQGRENGELRLKGTGSDPSYEGSVIIPVFRIASSRTT